MGRIKRHLLARVKAFIVRVLVEDFKSNGETRALLMGETRVVLSEAPSAALFSDVVMKTKLAGRAAFKAAEAGVMDTEEEEPQTFKF